MSPLALLGSVVAFFIALRLFELRLAARNARRLCERGALEVGAAHYPWLVAVHLAYFVLLIFEGWFRPRPLAMWNLACLALLLPVLGLRWWTLHTLGERWTTRVLVVPGEEVVTRGPYRYVRHPNYVVVVLEAVLVALGFRAWLTLAVTVPCIFAILVVRVRAEERALRAETDWDQALADRPRFLP